MSTAPPPKRRDVSGGVIAVALGVVVLLGAAGGLFALASLRGSGDAANDGVYVSLGDSVAAGNGASDPQRSGFVPVLAAREGVESTFNVAVAGATTQDVIDKQVAKVLSVVQAGSVSFITISAGGNDLAGLIPNAACTQDPLPASCPLDEALAGVEARLDTILRYLRDANVRVPIVLLAYPNFFSGTGHAFDAPAARVLPRLERVIARVAARYERVAVAAPAAAFEGRGGELTGVLAQPFDPHPNDDGHRIIAAAMADALKHARD